TASDRLKNFPGEISTARLAALNSGDAAHNRRAAQDMLGGLFGEVVDVDATDGIRITFASDEVVHLRASGNAPELRCYTEAATSGRASDINRQVMAWLEKWRSASG
ncbi:MAG: phosphomannomutase, partial [Mariprofundaceae bacterium]